MTLSTVSEFPSKHFKTSARDLPVPSIANGPPPPTPADGTTDDVIRFANPRDWIKWSAVQADARNQCVKAITRLLLFKAGRKEHVTRDVIAKCLEELNPDFKSYANVVLDLANTKLQTLFDYRVIAWYPRIGTKLPGFSGGIVSATVEPASTNNSSSSSSSAGGASSVPTYYVVNCSHNPRLLAILADPSLATSTDHDDVVIAHSSDHIAAYQAFCYVVLTLLFISPGRKVKAEDLLAMLRKIDPRFPETDLQTTKASGLLLVFLRRIRKISMTSNV